MGIANILVVRHAESQHHVKRLSGGWTDTPLTPAGQDQARLLAARLQSEFEGIPVRLYTSDLLRALETATLVGARLGVEPLPDARLRELNNGEAANLTIEEALARFPEPPGPWPADYRHWPSGETLGELWARAADFLASLDLDGPVPIVVTHGGTVSALVRSWLGLTDDVSGDTGFLTHVTGITILRRDARGGRRLERLNDISHLAGRYGDVPLAPAGR